MAGADSRPGTPLGEDLAVAEGAALLRDIEAFNRRFVVLPAHAALVLALWQIGTHCFTHFEAIAYLALLSPVKGCGKTRATEVGEVVVARPFRSLNATAPVLFRMIEANKPTLILDEAELLSGRGERAEEVRAVLNAGNRTGATVARCVGPNHEVRNFKVYCPKILCAIAALPETIRDRSIVIPMQRKRPTEKVERFILRRVREDGGKLRARIESFVQRNSNAIRAAYEALDLDFLTDRDADNFEPLAAILQVADPARWDEFRQAAEVLTSAKRAADEEDSASLRLLADVRSVWSAGERRILSRDLLKRLFELEDGAWGTDGSDLSTRKLSRTLGAFGVPRQDVRVGLDHGKGYKREDAEDAFARYLTPESVTSVTTPTDTGDSSISTPVTTVNLSPTQISRNPMETQSRHRMSPVRTGTPERRTVDLSDPRLPDMPVRLNPNADPFAPRIRRKICRTSKGGEV